MIEIFCPPERPCIPPHDATPEFSLFLAGSIDMGAAEDWQTRVCQTLTLSEFCQSGKISPLTIFNPRRPDWDSSWKQEITDPQFKEQVDWELDHLNIADVALFYFDPNGKAPITLMELGIRAELQMRYSSMKAFVCCPKGFWRRGNVEIVCDRYNIPFYETLDDSIDSVESYFG